MRTIHTNRLAVGTLSLITAGAIGGGVVLGITSDTREPVELRQVADTATATVTATTTTATASPSSTTTTAAPTRTAQPVAPKVQTTAEPQPVEPEPVEAEPVAPQPVEPEPVQTTPQQMVPQPPPVIPGNGPHIAGTVTIPAG